MPRVRLKARFENMTSTIVLARNLSHVAVHTAPTLNVLKFNRNFTSLQVMVSSAFKLSHHLAFSGDPKDHRWPVVTKRNSCNLLNLLDNSITRLSHRRHRCLASYASYESKVTKKKSEIVIDGCFVYSPIETSKLKAVVSFIGGAFLGATPDVLYK